jgi:hypothetical protein
LNSAIAGTVLGGLADIAKAFDVSPSPGSPEQWNEQIAIDPLGVMGDLAAPNLQFKTPVNSFTRRWPYISFLGGMAMGNRSEDLEFFCTEPFKWHSTIFDYVLEDEGDIYGLRARIVPYKELGAAKPLRGYLLHIRTDVLLAQYHPSYIHANGRRAWDYKKHKMGARGIDVPFSVEEPAAPLTDIVVDKEYTPDTRGLAFRMFFVYYLSEPGIKVDLAGDEPKASGSPADKLQFYFGAGGMHGHIDNWGGTA